MGSKSTSPSAVNEKDSAVDRRGRGERERESERECRREGEKNDKTRVDA